MCGIAGQLHLKKPPELEKLERHSRCFKSRGPDNYGAGVFQNVGFCHRRLSIIDLDVRSNQPMKVGSNVIVYNGEIYNFQELKEELIQLGKKFQTSSDTEVLLIAYEEWGISKTLRKLEGMYAFALYDTLAEKLYMARDIYGQKPLYWYKDSTQLLISSDIRFISQQTSGLTIDNESLDFYFQELAMPQPNTIWKQIKQVEPGHYYEVDVSNLNLSRNCFHDFDFTRTDVDWDQALLSVENTLQNSIKKRLVADVPVACFLSGGIDSGLIVSLLAKNSTDRINTFSVGFKEDDFNELPYAKKLAERYGTNHMELLIEPKIEEDIHSVLSDLGEPFGDSSLIPSYLITREMAGHYKVALSGDGGDELFGYPSYADFFELETFLNKVPKQYRNIKISGSKVFSRLGIGSNLGRFQAHMENQENGEYLKREMVFGSSEMNRLFQNPTGSYTQAYLEECWNSWNANSITDRVIAGSLKSRLLNDYLTKVDRSSMMNSLEVRSPFLDKELASLVFSIPNSIKFRGNQPKAVLKELAKRYIDPEIHKRRKSGFGIPINHWLKKELRPLLDQYLSTENLKKHNLFNQEFVHRVVKDHMTGSADNRHKLWCLLSFQIWFENNA